MGLNELREKARYIPNFGYPTGNQSFPHLRISQKGSLVKWTFTARKLEPTVSRTRFPQLIIIPSYCNREEVQCSYDILNSSRPVVTDYPNVYESTVDPPVPVNVGDTIAIHQPPDERAVMQLVFVRVPPVEQQEINSSESLPLHPLVHLHIGKNNEVAT